MTDRSLSDRLREAQISPSVVLAYLLVWLAIAAIAAMTTFIGLRGSSLEQWFSIFTKMLEYFYGWAAILLLIGWVQGRTRSRPGLQALLQLLLLAVVVLTMPFIFVPDNWREWFYGSRAPAFHALNILMFALAFIAVKVFDYYRAAKAYEKQLFAAELERVELEKAAESSRMDALRAQINPHFLFNTLNSVAALIESSSNREAYDVVARLAELLRHSFDYSRDRLVTLGEELRFLDTYLEIEQIRFGPRLRVRKSIPEAYLGMEVPSFSLQPLVENTIKHAVATTSQTVSIDIIAARDNDTLTLTVADNGPGPGASPEFGVGLGNIRSRIEHLYGKRAKLELAPGDRGGAVASLALPCQAAVEPESAASDGDRTRSGEPPAAPLAGQLE